MVINTRTCSMTNPRISQSSYLNNKSYHLSNNICGFTLIELMIVVSIIGILAAIAVPNYQWGVIKAREAVLRDNLYSLRSAIDQYCADQGEWPANLADLTTPKPPNDYVYIKKLPKDPMTKLDNWNEITASSPCMPGKPVSGIDNVGSNSSLEGSNKKPYNDVDSW